MRFQCPYCRGIVAVENSDLGDEVQCGHCGDVVVVPSSRVASGAVVNDFIVLEEIGKGGMGVVYLAYQISLDRSAALKVLHENFANNAEFVVGFIKEARAAAKLNHPHIVQAYAVGEDEGAFYFAMEYIDGETMKSILKKRGKIPVDEALMVIQQIAEALDYAWTEAKLIHRDIKPDNIMITKNGRAKLADLGLARVASDIDDSNEDEVMGTPQYISPEHLTGAPMDVGSDIYSLGATFYHMLSGRFPYEGKSATEIARQHLDAPVPNIRSIESSVPESVNAIIKRMMAKESVNRYQSAADLVEDIRLVRRGKDPKHAAAAMRMGGGKKKTLQMNRGGAAQTTVKTAAVNPRATTFNTGNKTQKTPAMTASGSRSSAQRMSRGKMPQNAKAKFILLAAVLVVGIAVAVGIVIMKWAARSGGAAGENRVKTAVPGGKTTPKKKEGKKKNSSEYSVAAGKIIAAAKKSPEDSAAILAQGDEFFRKYPETPDQDFEQRALTDLLAVFVPLDETRVQKARGDIRKVYERKLADKRAAIENKKRLAEAEEERKRREAAQQAERERIKAAQRERAEKRLNDYRNMLSDSRSSMGERFVRSMDRTPPDFDSARSIFEDAVKERGRVADNDFKKDAEEYSKWARNMIVAIDAAEKLYPVIYDSGEALKGKQVEIKKGLGPIQKVEDGKITVKVFGTKDMTVPISEMSDRQFYKYVRKAAEDNAGEDDAFFFFMVNGKLNLARKCAPKDWIPEVDKLSRLRSEYKKK